jgi:arylsulfatase A-like enzyme
LKNDAILVLIALLLVPLTTLRAAESNPSKPNILLIYSDDHGWADLGAQGVDKDIRTPNLDQLARDGVRFARGYVSAPQCVPSRAGVLTGRHQQKFGVEDNNKGPLPLAELTIAERLKPAGYVSGQVGKWHLELGDKKARNDPKGQLGFLPHAQGFDEYWCGTMRQYHASHDLQGQPLADAPKLVADARFRVVVQTDAALSFLDRRSAKPEQPWFLYLAWFAPHVPLESPEPWFAQTPANLPKERRQAMAMIAAMDDGLGRIRAKLKAMGAEKNTLIFFIGDNGAPLKEGAWNGSLNLPLIGEKGMLTDGGLRTPFVAAWPGRISAGQVYEKPVSALDVAATAVALAGQPHEKLDGVNLLPFVTGEKKSAPPHEALYWRWRSQAAVLEFPWKLIRLGEKERYLFDVTSPEGETKNLLAAHPEIAARLEAKLTKWSATLQPPGPAEPSNPQDNMFFAAHVDKTLDHATKRGVRQPAAQDGVQGWICRNGVLAVKDGALVVTPDAAAKGAPFLAHAGLDLAGPVTVTLSVRAKQGGKSTIAWRTKAEKDFTPENVASFDWPASEQWREVKVELPVKGRLLHLRLAPAKASNGLEVRSIQMRGKDGEPQLWQFGDVKWVPHQGKIRLSNLIDLQQPTCRSDVCQWNT